MVESGLFTFFSRLAQAYVWTKTKAIYQSCTLRILALLYIIFVAEPTFGRFVTMQRLSSNKLLQKYEINWREVIVHHEGISEDGNTAATVKIAVEKAKPIKI